MENLEQEEHSTEHPQLIVTEEMRSHIYEMTKWAKFLSIVGFIFGALMAISAFGVGAAFNSPQASAQLGPLAKLGSVGITIMYLAFAFIYFYPSLLLFKFSSQGNEGVLYGNQAQLNEAIHRLKSLFKFWGFVTIIGFIFFILLIFMIIGMGAAGMAG